MNSKLDEEIDGEEVDEGMSEEVEFYEHEENEDEDDDDDADESDVEEGNEPTHASSNV